MTKDQGAPSLSGSGALGEGGGETEADEEAADARGSRRHFVGGICVEDMPKYGLEKLDQFTKMG